MLVRKLSFYGCFLLLSSCGGSPPPFRPLSASKGSETTKATDEKLGSLLTAYELAKVAPGTYGPVSLALEGGTLSVWASPGPKERTWYARSIDRDGHASLPAQAIGRADLELGLVTLAAVSQGLRSLLVYSTQPSGQTTKLHALLLDPSGAPKAPIAELLATESPLLFIQVVDTPKGPLVFYALSRDNLADVRALGLTPEGAIRFVDREVAVALRAWQIVPAPDGATLAVVRAAGQAPGGIVSLLLLDRDGMVVKGPIDLDEHATVELDLDLTRVANNYVVAWSDRRAIDSRIQLAAVDPTGNVVTKPAHALVPIGEQTLVKLVPPTKGGRAVLVWENATFAHARRVLSMAELDQNAQIGKRVVHLVSSSRSSALPEIIASENGLRALTFDDAARSSAGESADPMPTFVEFGPELEPRAAVPLTLRATQDRAAVPLLAWGLDCRHGCRALAALDDNPVTIATVDLGSVDKRPGAAERVREVAFTEPTSLPRLNRLNSVVEVEPLADLDATATADGFQLAMVTYFDATTPLKRLAKPGPDGRTDPLQARVDVVSLGLDDAVRATQTISYRAASLPGLSIAPSKDQTKGTLVAWAAPEQGQPQLFATLLGSEAKKRSQRMLTHKRGRLDEIALAAVEDGWIVAWADERTDEPQLYGTRLLPTLERRGTEQRLTNGRGEISTVALGTTREGVIVAYAAARKNEKRRSFDLYTRRLSPKDAQPLDTEHRVLEIPGTAKFLAAAPHGDGIVLGWLEIATESGLADGNASVRFLKLDAKGQPVSQPLTGSLGDGIPATFAFECPRSRCHAVMVADVGGRGELRGVAFDPEVAALPKPVPLARSLGTVEQNVPPVLIGEHVFMVDQVDAERARVVHAKLQWE